MTFVSAILIFLACIAGYFILNYRRRQSSIKAVNTLPGPKTFPLIGNAFYFLRSPELLYAIIELTENYSYDCSPVQVWMGNKLFITISKPDQIQTILQNSHSLDKNIIYHFFESTLGKGILTAPASIWTKYRKMIAPCFNTKMLQKYFDIFVEQSLIFTDKLEKVGLNEKEVFFLQHITEYTVTIAIATMMDIKFEHLPNIINQSFKALMSFKESLKIRMGNIFLYPDFIFNLSATRRKQQKCINIIHSLIDEITQQIYTLNELNTNKTKSETSYRPLLHILIEAVHKNKCTHELLHDNMITMLAAASDTTAVTMTFVILMLANFPDIQEKAYKELWEIYGTKTPKSTPIKYEDLQHMNYLERIIKETMRMFPTVPIIGRYLTEDIKMGDVILPKGSNIVIIILSLHRNKKYWPNPLVFDPDRFLPERIGTSYNHYYMPFSMGPRNCIGMKYAMISMKVVLANLIRTFMFKIDKSIEIDKMKLTFELTLSPVEPIKVKIEKRDLH